MTHTLVELCMLAVHIEAGEDRGQHQSNVSEGAAVAAHVGVIAQCVLREECSQTAANDAAPIATLNKELLEAQTQHQIAHNHRYLSCTKALLRGTLQR